MTENKQFVVAGDIGYSNLKGAWGFVEDNEYKSIIRPATAAPRENLPPMSGNSKEAPEIRVLVDGEPWVACVTPGRLENYSRELHHDYPSTKAYKALFHALLQMAGQQVVDKFVTGLPVQHWRDKKYVEALTKMVVGTHQITKGRQVEVKSVEILPQPAGAFFKYMIEEATKEQLRKFEKGFVAILDPGFFSTDFCGFFQQGMRRESSGTSLDAMSKLIECTNDLIHEDEGGPSTKEAIEHALQSGEDEVLAGSEFVKLGSYIEEAKSSIAKKAVNEMVSSFRDEPDPAMIITAGGGGDFYKDAAQDRYPRAEIVSVSPTGIVEGFWQRGAAQCRNQ